MTLIKTGGIAGGYPYENWPYTPYISPPSPEIDWTKVFANLKEKPLSAPKFYAASYPSIQSVCGPFDSQDGAKVKAEEMAKAAPGKEFVVLQALTKSTAATVTTVAI